MHERLLDSGVSTLQQGNVFIAVLKHGTPMILSMFVQSLSNIVDIAILGHFTDLATTTGVAIGGQFVFLITNILTGLSSGSGILISRFASQDNIIKLKNTIFFMFLSLTFIGVVLGVVGFFSASFILNILRTPTSSIIYGRIFIELSMISLASPILFNGVICILRGFCDTKFSFLITLTSCILNIGLDLLTVSVFKLSVYGVFIATIASQILGVIVALIYLFKKRSSVFSNKVKFRLDSSILKEFLKIGMPLGFLNLIASISFIFLTFIVDIEFFDNLEIALAHSIVTRYNGFAVLPTRAMAYTIATLVSQNIAVNKHKRAKSFLICGCSLCFVFGILACVTTFLFPDFLITLFGGNASIANAGRAYMKIISMDYLLLPIGVCACGFLEGNRKAWISMLINIVISLFVRIPIAYFTTVVFSFGLSGIGISILLSSFFLAIFAWISIFFFQKKAKSN
ncbi:MAG: MATE family efflux transporter [Christensenellaceae bacterium]|jgi:putative MATE family efflux protein|nr:MATE family efflux transporter [Christensenellaceae bacterium]